MRLLLILLTLYPFASFGALKCSQSASNSQLMSCEEELVSLTADGCENHNPVESFDESLTAEVGSEDLALCDEVSSGNKGKWLDDKEEKKILKQLAKQCKKEAKAYKKAVFKELVGEGKLGQALQVIFKGKKKITKGSGANSMLNVDLKDPDLSANKLNEYLRQKIQQKYPGLSKDDKKGNTILQRSTVPFNMVLQNKNGKGCKISAKDFPQEEPFTPSTCSFCEPIDIHSSFTNDCSYMVNPSQGLTEEKAQKILGMKGNKKDFCQPDMKNANNNLAPIQGVAQKLCKEAQELKEPSLTIETARNLFSDLTPDLAEKRGRFIQGYLRDQLKTECFKDQEAPSWIEDAEEFAAHVRIEKPTYGKEDNKNFPGWKAGDYGPSPYAKTPEEINQELAHFKENALRERMVIIEEMKTNGRDQSWDKIEKLKKELHGTGKKQPNSKEVDKGLAGQYEALKKSLNEAQRKNPSLVPAIVKQMTEIGNSALENYNEKHFYEQKFHENKIKFDILAKKLEEHDKRRDEKLKALQEYYNDPDRKNKAVFEDFKMVRIKGEESEENEFEPEAMTAFDPDVSKSLDAVMKLQTYTCQVNAIETKKASLQGVGKGILKVATIATLPVIAAGGAVVTVGMAPVTSSWGLLCRLRMLPCPDPGSEMPDIYYVGNITELDLSKSGRAEAWDNTKGFIRNYVNWGGTLKVKGNKHVNIHDLKKNHPDWENFSEEDQANAIDEFFKKNFSEEFNARLPGQTSPPKLGCNGSEINKNPAGPSGTLIEGVETKRQ